MKSDIFDNIDGNRILVSQYGAHLLLNSMKAIDRFFEFKHSLEDKLEYRSINFISETVDQEYFQENSVVNYPGIIEYTHFGNRKSYKINGPGI